MRIRRRLFEQLEEVNDLHDETQRRFLWMFSGLAIAIKEAKRIITLLSN
jgi:hypothetical protein